MDKDGDLKDTQRDLMETAKWFMEWLGGVERMGVLEANGKHLEEAIREAGSAVASSNDAVAEALHDVANAIRATRNLG